MPAGKVFTEFENITKFFTGQIVAVFDASLLIGFFFINHKFSLKKSETPMQLYTSGKNKKFLSITAPEGG